MTVFMIDDSVQKKSVQEALELFIAVVEANRDAFFTFAQADQSTFVEFRRGKVADTYASAETHLFAEVNGEEQNLDDTTNQLFRDSRIINYPG